MLRFFIYEKSVSTKISFFNFIMALAIVLYHFRSTFYDIPLKNTYDLVFLNIFNMFSEFIGSLALGFFFMLSGFLLYYNIKDNNDFNRKIKQRIISLGIPYLIWNFIIIIYFYIQSYTLPFNEIKEFFIMMILTPFDGPLWYIGAILLLLIPSYLINKLKNKKYLCITLWVSICIISFSISYLNIFPNLMSMQYGDIVERFVRYLPNYFLGVMIALLFPKFISEENYNTKYFSIISSGLFLAGFILLYYFVGGSYEWIFLRLAPILLWFAISSNCFKKSCLFPSRLVFSSMYYMCLF